MFYLVFLIVLIIIFSLVYYISENFEEIKDKLSIVRFVGVIFAFLILIMAYFWGSQKIAMHYRYNPEIVGEPIFNNLYSPFLILKLAFIPNIKKILYISTVMRKIGLFLNIISILILVILLKRSKVKEDSHGTARWAKLNEWKKAGLLSDYPKYTDGVILGRTGEYKKGSLSKLKTIIDNLKTHIAVVAPTRSGKGVGIIIPTLLNWLGSIFVFDMKGENYAFTAGYRMKVLGQKILKFRPYSFDGSVSYNPLAEVELGTVKEVKGATVIADILTDPGENKQRDHWANSASSLLVGLILYVLYKAKNEGRMGSIGDVVDFLTDTSRPLDDAWQDLMTIPLTSDLECIKSWKKIYSKQQMSGIPDGVHPVVARTAAEMLNKDPKERASVISSVMSKLTLFKDPIIRKNTTNVDFRIKDLMDYETPVSFYVVVESQDMATLAPLLKMLLTQVIGVLAPEMDFESGEEVHKHKLLLMLDEFAAFGTIPILEKALAYVAGYGMKAVIIAQALNQIRKNYGDKSSIFDNCATTVFYAPTPLDSETPRQISELLGDTTIKVRNKSWKAYSLGQANLSESNQVRKLLTPEEVRNKIGDKRNIISIAGMYPLMAYKIRFYEEEYFKTKTFRTYGIPKVSGIYERPPEDEIIDGKVLEELQDMEAYKEMIRMENLEDYDDYEEEVV